MEQQDIEWLVEDLSMDTLTEVMHEVGQQIKDNAQQGASEEEWLDSQAMCVVEEAGEFIGEYRRLRGFARRPGNREDLLSELADVIIAAGLMFSYLDADMHEEIQAKLRKIVTRGYVNKEN